MKLKQLAGLSGGAALMFAAAAPTLAQQGSIKVDGSSTVFPISTAVAEAFMEESDADVSVNFSGTGSGMTMLADGQIDIANASRPMKGKERTAVYDAGIEFIEVPVAYDGLSIVTNKANNWANELTVDQLRKIFVAPGVNSWNEVDPSFPAIPIKIYAPGEASGTYDYFKEVISGKKDKTTGLYKYGNLRDDMTKSEDDNVLVTGVSGEPGGIGFFGVAYYEENKDTLNAVKVFNKDGEAVGPAAETIEDGSYNPFGRPLFVYVNAASLQRPEVKSFMDFYLEEGAELAEEVGYVRLPQAVYDAAQRKIDNAETGSVYLDDEGNDVAGSVVELYQ